MKDLTSRTVGDRGLALEPATQADGDESVLVLTSCTASKTAAAHGRAIPAEALYTGQQHVRLMRGVAAYRAAGQPAGGLDVRIVSAAHGVVPGTALLGAYDASFTGMSMRHLSRRSAELGIPRAVTDLLAARRRLALVLLGESYLCAARLSASTEFGAPTIVFTGRNRANELASASDVCALALENSHPRRFSCGLTALKGELGARVLLGLTREPTSAIPTDPAALLDWLDCHSTYTAPNAGAVRAG
jgi:hypothetical protein